VPEDVDAPCCGKWLPESGDIGSAAAGGIGPAAGGELPDSDGPGTAGGLAGYDPAGVWRISSPELPSSPPLVVAAAGAVCSVPHCGQRTCLPAFAALIVSRRLHWAQTNSRVETVEPEGEDPDGGGMLLMTYFGVVNGRRMEISSCSNKAPSQSNNTSNHKGQITNNTKNFKDSNERDASPRENQVSASQRSRGTICRLIRQIS
jgi:hypothetical protein